jgi:phosphomannomutase
MKDVVADQVHGVGWPPFKELLEKLIAHGVPIFV